MKRGVKAFKRRGSAFRKSLYKFCFRHLTKIRAELFRTKNLAKAKRRSESIQRTSIINAKKGMSIDDKTKHSYNKAAIQQRNIKGYKKAKVLQSRFAVIVNKVVIVILITLLFLLQNKL